jgi:hypothetical protein
MKTIKGYTKESVFREVRKLVDTLNRFGNCGVPSIHEDGSNTSAQERLVWILNGAKEEFDMTLDDIQEGINTLT